jgi:hypothetical protein
MLQTILDLPVSSPLEHLPRSLFSGGFAVIFALVSIQFLRAVNSGSTILIDKHNPLLSFQVREGKVTLAKSQIARGLVKSYNGPLSTAFMGLLFFAAAQFLIVLVFKTATATL